MKVELQTSGGEFVTHEWIIPMQPLPEMIIWGTRTFLLFPTEVDGQGRGVHDMKTPPIYREGFAFAIPEPQMFKEQVQKLLAHGSLPEDCR